MPPPETLPTPAPLPLGPVGVALGGGGPLVFLLGPCVIEGEAFLWRHARAIAETCRELGAPFVFKASYDKANRTSASGFRGGLGARAGCELLGPCVIEGEAFLWRHARAIAETCRELGAPFVFKASYDKANRTSASGFRGGLGARAGCELLAAVGRELGVPVTTDVHSPAEAETAAEAGVDVLQIPAFLCRQTDLVQTAAATGKVVNVKKGQFLAPWDVAPIAGKLRAAAATHVRDGGADRFFFTERGTTFGYNNLVADMRSLPLMRADGFRVVFDATHSVQRPGGGGGHTTGDGALAPVLARAAVAAGCDGVFLETHEDPARAASDGPNQIPLRQLPALLLTLQRLHEVVAVQA